MKSLTFRLTIWYACVVTATVGLVLWVGRYYLETNLLKGVDFLNHAEFEEVVHRLQSHEGALDRESLVEMLREHTEIDASFFFFQINGADGELYFKSINLGPQSLSGLMHGQENVSITDAEHGHLRVGEYTYEGLDIHIASSLQSVDALFKDSLMWLLWILFAVFGFSLALGLLLSRLALNPVRNIQAIARRISGDNLSERIPVPATGDEISRLGEFLNEMFDRLEAAFQQISRFTADASHELRTPLSLIRLHGERLLRNPELPVEERMHGLNEQMLEIERLNKLIDDLLFIARADAGVLRLSRKELDLAHYLEDLAEDARALCDDQGIQFELSSEGGPTSLSFDPVWMRHVFLNLLSNALKVSEPGATIRLVSRPLNEKTWGFIMEDEGSGLNPDEVEQIFERFKHFSNGFPDEGREPRAPGTGLGLAICRTIVSQHGGRIYARIREDRRGLCLHVEIPRQ